MGAEVPQIQEKKWLNEPIFVIILANLPHSAPSPYSKQPAENNLGHVGGATVVQRRATADTLKLLHSCCFEKLNAG